MQCFRSFFNDPVSNEKEEKQGPALMSMHMKTGEEGVLAFKKGDYLGAIINLDAALFLGSKNLHYYKTRGLSYMYLGDMVGAIKDFSTLIEHDKNNLEYLIKRGYLYEKIGFLSRATADYRQALRFNTIPVTCDGLEKTDLFIDLCNKAVEEESVNDNIEQQFLIVANPRTGSTWLELMLNCLPDVDADLEFKWSNQDNVMLSIDETLTPTLTNPLFSLIFSEALHSISHGNITGSKLVVDFNVELPNFDILRRSLDAKKIKIIHLTRNYHEIIESVRHGYVHVKNDSHVGTKNARLLSVLSVDNIHIQPLDNPEYMPEEMLLSALDALFKTDVFFKSLENEFEYMSVDYSYINQDFYKIARFIGSAVDEAFIPHLLSNPPTKKRSLPFKPDIDGYSYELIEVYERCRKNLFESDRIA